MTLSTEQIKSALIENLSSLEKGVRVTLKSSLQKAVESIRKKHLDNLDDSEKRVVALDNFRFAASWLNYRNSKGDWKPEDEELFQTLFSKEISPVVDDAIRNPENYQEVPKKFIGKVGLQSLKIRLDRVEQRMLGYSFVGKAAAGLKKVSLKVAQVAQNHLPKLNILLLAVGAYTTENPAFLAFAGGYALTC